MIKNRKAKQVKDIKRSRAQGLKDAGNNMKAVHTKKKGLPSKIVPKKSSPITKKSQNNLSVSFTKKSAQKSKSTERDQSEKLMKSVRFSDG